MLFDHRFVISEDSKTPAYLLNLFNKLYLSGVHKYIQVPKVIICGDQSSGRAAVLQALTSLEMPEQYHRNRFKTEFLLRSSPEDVESAAWMWPDSDGTSSQKGSMGNQLFLHLAEESFNTEEDSSNLQAFFSQANNYFCRFCSKAKAINETLHVRLEQPDLPQLTIVDYPGLAPSFDHKVAVPDPKEDPVGDSLFQEMRQKRNLIICVHVFKAQLMSVMDEFLDKMQEVVRSYKVAQPVPYYSSLVKKMQQARKDCQTSELRRILLDDVIRVDHANIPSSFRQPTMTVESLAQCLVSCLNEDGSAQLTYETLTDYVEEYYNLALQGLLESIRVQAVGGCLIQKLTDVFDPNNTDWITDDIVSQVEFESEETKAEKRLLGRKILVLGKGVKIIDEYLAPTPADSSGQSSSSSEPVETPDETPVETPDETPVVDFWGVVTDN
ncbi:hypothetical protein Cob_v008188 [Colletotrichum orbiculare MAFF 240422]|uniref:Dynamin N-terminal domain-containing protein n=1 Tax=Colletotrichum orbiculare (strain 104-T / ATCC 96160 / CBS 514.97 / LARS 414 / MAFF 240422) TaxID=1213857 RepID=A0A484FMJ6_COLOR|nr:hypothetical protein Cob_v008188 [Colletotrichum orbiculare MAFF 240422]